MRTAGCRHEREGTGYAAVDLTADEVVIGQASEVPLSETQGLQIPVAQAQIGSELERRTNTRRRNPSRTARPPVDIDFDEWGYFVTPAPNCGLVKQSEVRRIKAGPGPPLRLHTDDHRTLWIRQSVHCPGGNWGLYLEAETCLPRGYLIAIYEGDSCDSLNIPYKEALLRWESSDYVLSHPASRYVVNGALECGAARANDSFGDANAFLYFNPRLRRFELRLAAWILAGFYEILVNYTAPHRKSSFWTEENIAKLPEVTQQRARAFYRDKQE